MGKMNYTMLSFGLMMIILGLIVTYVMISSLIKITASFEEMGKQLTSGDVIAKRNEIITNSLPGLATVAIGVLLIRLSLIRKKFQ
jgi:mannose/fructose/N-acetylgalactosamine-specific phosphotransferase system component IID